MKILVIDDSAQNVASAKATLPDHDLSILNTIQAAYDVLNGNERFDAVLTDLFMPIGAFIGAVDTSAHDRPTTLLPAGLVFAMAAANKGMPVVICTDSDHHEDWICSLLDLLHCGKPRVAREMLGAEIPAVVNPHYRISFVEARVARMDAIWENDQIVPCDHGEVWKHPILIKDWKVAMGRSGLFLEFWQDSFYV